MGHINRRANPITKSYMRHLMCALALIFGLAAASPASASSFTAEICGMRITVEQPWYLYTHGEAGHRTECFFFALMDVVDGAGDIKGDGVVYEFPVAEGDALPASEQVRNMDAAQLRELVQELDRKYTQFSPADGLILAEINGFTAIVRKDQKKTANDPFQFSYYFPLRDRLVFLTAGVYGTVADAALLERICASFIPETSPVQALNTVTGDGISLSFPPSWSVVMSGFTGKKDTVWAVLGKWDSEEDNRLGRISVLGPVTSTATMFTSSLVQLLGDAEQGKLLAVHALGYRAPLENIRMLRDENITTAPGLQARLRAMSGKTNGEYAELTFQDISKGDKLLTVVTCTPLPLADETRQELETIYASLKIEGKESEITEHLNMNLLELLRYLKENRPVTSQTVEGLGLTGLLAESFRVYPSGKMVAGSGLTGLHVNTKHYKANGILLSDGTVIKELELREHEGGALFILQFGEHYITLEQLEAELGTFRLFDAPRGKSIHEHIVYVNDSTEHFIVMIGLDQTTRALRTLSIRHRLDGK